MKLPTALTIAILTFQAEAWSGNIQKLTANSAEMNMVDLSPVSAFTPIQLRQRDIGKRGRWTEKTQENKYLKILEPAALATLSEYSMFIIQNFSVAKDKFLVEIDFCYGDEPTPQVIYVTGDLNQGDTKPLVSVTGYADKDPAQETRRISLKNFENIINPRRDFQSVEAQVHMEDVRRTRIVEQVLEAWMSSMGLSHQHTANAVILQLEH